jgi:2-hydroxychromene-2-carboxylate isomerase
MLVDFVLDYRSPYAYLANTQLRTLGAQINYQPTDIVWVMKKVNNQPTPMCPPKAKYAGLDAFRWAKHYGVPYSPNRTLLNGLFQGHLRGDLLSRAAIASQQLGAFEQINDALFSLVWAGSDDLTSEKGRAQFAASRSLPKELWEVAESAEVEERLTANNECAAARGVFGVPTFFVNDEMFFGNDRLSFVKDRLDQLDDSKLSLPSALRQHQMGNRGCEAPKSPGARPELT